MSPSGAGDSVGNRTAFKDPPSYPCGGATAGRRFRGFLASNVVSRTRVSPRIRQGGCDAMRRDKINEGRGFEEAVEQAAFEWIDKTAGGREANPNMRLIDLVPPEALSLWFTYVLIRETKRVGRLTLVLIILTAVLAVLTLRLALA